MTILQIPGYAEAIVRERFLRDSAFLGVTETVGGFELKPLTLRHYLLLRILRSPLLYDETPSPVELAQFLWSVSAEYSTDPKARKRFLKRCRKFTPPAPPLLWESKRWRSRFNAALLEMAKCLTETREYISEAMMDRPPSRIGGGFAPDYYSEVAWWVGLFEHRYTADQLLDMPLKALFQYLQEYKDRKGSMGQHRPTLFNPSDKVRARFTLESN